MAKEKKPYIYKGYEFTDNGHGDYYNAEVDKFLIFRPGPMMVDTVMHKDGSVTMNQEKFKENTDKNKGVYEEGYELNEDGSVFVKEEDVDKEIKEESEDNKNTSEGQEVQNRFEKEVSTDIDSLAKRMLALDKKYSPYTGYTPSDEDMLSNNLFHLQGDDESLSEVVAWYTNEIIANDDAPEEDKKEAQSIIDAISDMGKVKADYEGDEFDQEHDEEWYEKMNKTEPESYEEGVERRERATQMYLDGDIDYDDLVDIYFEGNREGADEYINNLKGEESHEKREYRFDFGFKDGASLRDDAFDDAKAYLEEEDMAQYLDEPLKSKIDSMRWVLDDVDAVHVEVKSNQPLTDEDMKALKKEIEGQNSDGLGEGFEQQDFAEAYWDPDTGDGPYTRSEVLDIVQENYDNMDFDEYRDNIEYDDLREGLENYLKDGNYNVSFEDYLVENADWKEEGYNSEEEFRKYLEQTPEEQLFEEYNDTYDAWLDEEEDDFLSSGYAEDYISEDAIYNAKDQVVKNDARYNENLWDGGMTSMEWDIPDGVDVTPEKIDSVSEAAEKIGKLNMYFGEKYGDLYFKSKEDMEKAAQYIVDSLNKDYAKDYDADFKYRIKHSEQGKNDYIEVYDANESVGSTNKIYDKLTDRLKAEFSEEGSDIFAEPYDNVSVVIAGLYGKQDDYDLESGRKANRNYSDDELLDKVDKHYTPQIDNDTVSTIASAFNDINDSHAFGVDKAVDKLLEYGEVVKVNPGKNGSNQVEVEVNNGKGKIIFDRDGGRLIGEFPYTQLLTYAGAIEEYKKYKDSDVSFNFDRNRFEANIPKDDRLVPIDPNTPQEEAERITNNKKIMIEKQTDSAFSIPGKEWEVLEEGNSAFGNKLYKVKDSQGNVQWKDADDLEERTTKIEPRFTRIYENRDEAYKGYMNGEITFEEYEEYIKKLNRR